MGNVQDAEKKNVMDAVYGREKRLVQRRMK